jgi:Flp pilus assembly pilin Flp
VTKFQTQKLKTFLADESGATAIEYTLIIGAMCVCLIAAMPLIADPLSSKITAIGPMITNAK